MTGDPREDKQSLLRSQDVYDRSINETTQSYRSIDVNSGDTSEDDDTNTSGVSLILLTLWWEGTSFGSAFNRLLKRIRFYIVLPLALDYLA